MESEKRKVLAKVKTYSNKPVRVTLSDGSWVAAVSLVLTLIFLFCWYWLTDTPTADRVYAMAIVQTVVCCLVGQLVCEYTGINDMIAESSIKYSKGTTMFDSLRR